MQRAHGGESLGKEGGDVTGLWDLGRNDLIGLHSSSVSNIAIHLLDKMETEYETIECNLIVKTKKWQNMKHEALQFALRKEDSTCPSSSADVRGGNHEYLAFLPAERQTGHKYSSLRIRVLEFESWIPTLGISHPQPIVRAKKAE